MKEGTSLAFAHGLNIHFDLINARKDLDVFMVAGKVLVTLSEVNIKKEEEFLV